MILYPDADIAIYPTVVSGYEGLGEILPDLKVAEADWGELTRKEEGLNINEIT